MRHRLLLLLGSMVGLAAPSMADPPARVGRLNLILGTVSFRPASVDEWAIAQPNRTLTTGDKLWTDTASRAEVHVGSTALRLSSQTELDFVNVDDQTLQMRLAQGTATIRIRTVDDGQVYEIDTPNGAITFGKPGEYRVDVNTDGTQSVVHVWQGGVEVTAAGSSFEVNGHQVATVNGTDSPTYDLTDTGSPDDWDQWCLARDHREDASVSVRYVSREMPGYDDLDTYGHWTYVDGYGNVWVPDHVGPGWAPYHTGHWVWVDPWGWTWVDDAPWGYAPYHYGRWAYVQAQWVWCPNPVPPPPGPAPAVVVVARPVYAPALVAFVGGGGWSVGVGVGGGGGVGWVALGVGEVYHPPYAVSPGYVQQVNVVNRTTVINNNTTVINNNTTVVNNNTNITNNNTNITNNNTNVTNNNTNITSYRNASAPGAVTAVPASAMTSGASVSKSAVAVTPAQLAKAPVAGTGPPTGTVPQQSAVTGGPAAASAAVKAPPAAVQNRAVVAKTAPPPAAVPFAQKQQALAQNGGRPLAPAQENQIRQSMPASASHTALIKPAAATTNGGGLKPARAGLAAATPVKATGSNGFVAPPAKGASTVASNNGANKTATPGGGAPSGSRVPQPPDRSSTPSASRVGQPSTSTSTSTAASTNSKPANAESNSSQPKPANKPAPKAKKPPPKPKPEEKPEKGR
jgi:hypothetical protein